MTLWHVYSQDQYHPIKVYGQNKTQGEEHESNSRRGVTLGDPAPHKFVWSEPA